MNVLIINLTRLGDLIQTQPVISGFCSQGNRVGLVCIDNFAGAIPLLRDLTTSFSFSGARLLAALDHDWREGVRQIVHFCDHIREEFQPDIVVNLTPSIPAMLLARSLGAEDVRGFSLDQHGFNADTSSWAAFLQVAGGNRGSSPFNICDVFLRVAGLPESRTGLCLAKPEDNALTSARELLAAQSCEHAGFIGIQLGASEERRRWPIESFARAVNQLWEQYKLIPVVLGSKGEIPLGERLASKVNGPLINLQGKTSLVELAAVLSLCQALITNDTGTMHVAAGISTPLVAVFLATAQPWDTGPYGEGFLSLEADMSCHPCAFGSPCPRNEACRTSISPSAVVAAVARLCGHKASFSQGVRVWESAFDSTGFLGQHSLSNHANEDRSQWIAFQRSFYRRFLDGLPLAGEREVSLLLSAERNILLQKSLSKAKDYLLLLQQQGKLLAHNPRESLKRKFMASWQQLQNIMQENENLDVLSSLWIFESQQYGHDLAALMKIVDRYAALVSAMHKGLASGTFFE